MTPLRARWARGQQLVRCWLGRHEFAAEVPVTAEGERQPVLRERCLHCGQVTAGWAIEEGPRYHTTHEADRARLVLHNGRLRRCPCAECETKRHARRQRRQVVRLKHTA